MAIHRRDIIEILRDENKLLKERNHQVGSRLARLQQAFRVLVKLEQHVLEEQLGRDIDNYLHHLLELVMHACNIEHGSIVLLDEGAQELEFVEVIGDTRESLLHHRIKLDIGVVGHVMKTGKALVIGDVHSSKKWSSTVDDYLGFHTDALMCAPLMVNDQVMGAIELVTQPGDRAFDNNDLNILRIAAHFVSLAMEKLENFMFEQESSQ